MVLLEIHKRSKGHFLNELRVSFKDFLSKSNQIRSFLFEKLHFLSGYHKYLQQTKIETKHKKKTKFRLSFRGLKSVFTT